MIIDIHTHAFPDELAGRAIGSLEQGRYQPVHDGTMAGLLSRMDEWGVDISVLQPVVTRASQVRKANEWAKSKCSDRIIAFGGVYPHADDVKGDIDFVCDLGLKGLKFHAEYQDFVLDEPKMLRIYDYALSKGMIILHHAGEDPAFEPPYRSTPAQFKNVWNAMRGGTMIVAHLGGHKQWEDVAENLAGTGLYIDTSTGFELYTKEQFMSIVRAVGTDKVLFGSDSPWGNAKTELDALKSTPLAPHELEAILYKNAEGLLRCTHGG